MHKCFIQHLCTSCNIAGGARAFGRGMAPPAHDGCGGNGGRGGSGGEKPQISAGAAREALSVCNLHAAGMLQFLFPVNAQVCGNEASGWAFPIQAYNLGGVEREALARRCMCAQHACISFSNECSGVCQWGFWSF